MALTPRRSCHSKCLGRDAAVARLTGLEPATSGVTGRHSNQLSYNRPLREGRFTPPDWPRQAPLLLPWRIFHPPAPARHSSASHPPALPVAKGRLVHFLQHVT